MKAMEKDRARRYDTVGDLADDVRRYLDGEVGSARPASAAYRARQIRRAPQDARSRCRLSCWRHSSAGSAPPRSGCTVPEPTATGRVRAESAEGAERLAEQAARRDAVEKLWDSYLAQARAGRYSGRPGQRFEGLRALAARRPHSPARSPCGTRRSPAWPLSDIAPLGSRAGPHRADPSSSPTTPRWAATPRATRTATSTSSAATRRATAPGRRADVAARSRGAGRVGAAVQPRRPLPRRLLHRRPVRA